MAGPDDDLELTILMPCLDEAATVGRCVGKALGYLARAGIRGEVVVADNGSSDGSRDLAASAGARVIAVARRGYGSALRAGIRAGRGRYVIMGDADDSYDFSELDLFMAKLREGYALVMGNRFRGGIKPGAMPPLNRYLGNPVLSFLGVLFFKSPCRDFQCGLRGFERQAILDLGLVTTGMEFASEMVVKAALRGIPATEVPTTLSPDGRGRKPHLRPWRDGWAHLKFLLLHSPRWLYLYPGLAMTIGGLGAHGSSGTLRQHRDRGCNSPGAQHAGRRSDRPAGRADPHLCSAGAPAGTARRADAGRALLSAPAPLGDPRAHGAARPARRRGSAWPDSFWRQVTGRRSGSASCKGGRPCASSCRPWSPWAWACSFCSAASCRQ